MKKYFCSLSFIFLLNYSNLIYAATAPSQSMSKKNFDTIQQQIVSLQQQNQAQIKQLQKNLQQEIKSANTQLQNQIKNLQDQLQQQTQKLQEQINKLGEAHSVK